MNSQVIALSFRNLVQQRIEERLEELDGFIVEKALETKMLEIYLLSIK